MSEIYNDEGVMKVEGHGHFIITRDPDAAAIVYQVEGTDFTAILGEFPEDLDAEEAYAKALEEAKDFANIIAIVNLEAKLANA